MVNKLYTYFLILFASALIFSCSSSSNNSGGSLKLGEMSATVDGKSWKGQNATATKVPGNQINISGAKVNSNMTMTESISLNIYDVNVTSGNNAFGQFSISDITTEPITNEIYVNATGATYEITHIDDNSIEGTFEFVGTDDEGNTMTVTNGKFKVSIVN